MHAGYGYEKPIEYPGQEIGDGITIIWDIDNTTKHPMRYTPSEERCAKCNEVHQELFYMRTLLSHGIHLLCYDCIREIAEDIFSGGEICPVCGFGVLSFSEDGATCIFGHKWKEITTEIRSCKKFTVPVIIKGWKTTGDVLREIAMELTDHTNGLETIDAL